MQAYEDELEKAFGKPVYMTAAELRKVDAQAFQALGLPGLVLMENAGLHATEVALRMLPKHNPHAVVLCGTGNNGGDGYVIARQLFVRGIKVKILWSVPPNNLKGDALVNARAAGNLGIPTGSIFENAPPIDGHLVIDALIGTGLRGPVRKPLADAIQRINLICGENQISILSIDIPSGMNADTGHTDKQTIRASRTVTFVARKTAFELPTSSLFTGLVEVAPIGVPARHIIETLRIV